MAVNTTWSSPSTAGSSGGTDLAAGDTLSETVWDRVQSNLLRLGGTDGNTKTGGYTIDQGTDDGLALGLASSGDVAHGMTSVVATSFYGFMQKSHATDGGLKLYGLAASTTPALDLFAAQTTADTTKSTAAVGAIYCNGAVKSGTGVTALGANTNIATFGNAGATRFILDADGDSHQDVGTAWTTFDHYDDAALLNVLAAEVARPDDPIKEEFRGWLDYRRSALEEARLVTFNGDGHHFVNMSRLTMLLVGAVRQQGLRLREIERRLLPAG